MPKVFAVICKQCGAGFETKRRKQEYCSAKCRQIAFQKARKQAEYERGRRDAACFIWSLCLDESKAVIGTSDIGWAQGLQRACTLIEQQHPDVKMIYEAKD